MLRYAVPLLLTLTCTPAVADLRVTFMESAPKDSFVIENTAACALQDVVVDIDLSRSSAGLIFDVTGEGAGVEVFQPLEVVTGAALLMSVPQLADGDDRLRLSFRSLPPGAGFAFTIDVDDTAGTRATMISATEIEGAMITVEHNATIASASFGQDAIATAALGACLT